jgi:hypothetical protein
MPQAKQYSTSRVLVIGAQGVLGGLLTQAFEAAGWSVAGGGRRPDPGAGFRHIDLDEPETVAAATGEADVVINTVPDRGLTAERIVLEQGGMLINVSAMPAQAGRRLRHEAGTARGTVVMNAGIAPGVTNLIAADLLAAHPEADEVELAFTVSTKATSGRAGGDFAHRNLTTTGRHRTKVIPLPQPLGPRRCLGFAEPDGGWLGSVAGDRVISPYVCIAEQATHRALLAANMASLMSRLPRAAFSPHPRTGADEASDEPVAHWIAVLKQGQRIAAQTLQCRGDYRCAAASAVVFARALIAGGTGTALPRGVFDPEDLLSLDSLAPALREHGIAAVSQPVTASGAEPTPAPAGIHP